MGFLDNLVKSASDIAQQASEAVSSVATNVAEGASDLAQQAGEAISSAATSVADSFGSFYDDAMTIVDGKVRELISGIDFNATLEALDKYQKENGKDVTPLVNFIKNLQAYGNGTPSESQTKAIANTPKSVEVLGFNNTKFKISTTGDGRLCNEQGVIIDNRNTSPATLEKIINSFKEQYNAVYKISDDGVLRFSNYCQQ